MYLYICYNFNVIILIKLKLQNVCSVTCNIYHFPLICFQQYYIIVIYNVKNNDRLISNYNLTRKNVAFGLINYDKHIWPDIYYNIILHLSFKLTLVCHSYKFNNYINYFSIAVDLF